MPPETRFLIGYGERLTTRVAPPPGGGAPDAPYSYEEAASRLAPQVARLSDELEQLPELACPDDEAVGVVTMHPQAIAKSYSPRQFLGQYGLRQVGSRPTVATPERWTRDGEPTPSATTELYVAGSRRSFGRWEEDLESPERPRITSRETIQRLETVRAPTPADRLRVPRDPDGPRSSDGIFEIVLHAGETEDGDRIVRAFNTYANALDVRVVLGRRLFAGGLCFVPVEADADVLDSLAQFAFLRVARPLSRMRQIGPIERSQPAPDQRASPLPEDPPVGEIRAAVLDGGMPKDGQLAPWVSAHDVPGIGAPCHSLLDHGHDVTSSFLFGTLEPGVPAPRPYCYVDHYRVLDEDSQEDPLELYDVLRRVQDVLHDRSYEFFNLSLGPVTPVADDEVHPWTAVLDEHLSDGHAFATLAIGNTGEHGDPAEARVQVPSDCVNAFAVGAADSTRMGWQRASYSSIGPGRSPGVVKPDAVDFGGCAREPFYVVQSHSPGSVAWTQGTSFAAPSALRRAVGLRVHFGDRLSPLAIKALLLHTSEPGNHNSSEVGWGRLRDDLSDIVVCPDGTVRVVYQGELTPSQYLRAAIPVPPGRLEGLLTLRATFTYATPVDPEDPGTYTRSGLDVTFRPNSKKFKEDAVNPDTTPFFRRNNFDSEQRLRADAHKWETVLRSEKRFRASTLHNPVFDVHYNARESGGLAVSARNIKYALVIDVVSKLDTLYDEVLRIFAGRLEAFRPTVEIPIQIDET